MVEKFCAVGGWLYNPSPPLIICLKNTSNMYLKWEEKQNSKAKILDSRSMTDSKCSQPFRKDSAPEGCSVTLPSPQDSVLIHGPGTLMAFQQHKQNSNQLFTTMSSVFALISPPIKQGKKKSLISMWENKQIMRKCLDK